MQVHVYLVYPRVSSGAPCVCIIASAAADLSSARLSACAGTLWRQQGIRMTHPPLPADVISLPDTIIKFREHAQKGNYALAQRYHEQVRYHLGSVRGVRVQVLLVQNHRIP